MAVTVNVDMSGAVGKLRSLGRDRELGLRASSEAARLMEKFVPKRDGFLMQSAETDEPWLVRYTMPYARRIYYGDGFNFSTEKHPLARSRWDRGIDKDELARSLEEFAGRM